MLQVSVYRYNPETDAAPFMKDYEVDTGGKDLMVLDVLALVKEQDPTLAYRRSCREGVCGSDGRTTKARSREPVQALCYLLSPFGGSLAPTLHAGFHLMTSELEYFGNPRATATLQDEHENGLDAHIAEVSHGATFALSLFQRHISREKNTSLADPGISSE